MLRFNTPCVFVAGHDSVTVHRQKEGAPIAMDRIVNSLIFSFVILLAISSNGKLAYSHDHKNFASHLEMTVGSAVVGSLPASPSGVSGQGAMKFRVAYTADHLPEEAVQVLVSAHGGFAVDRRDKKGEIYFALPGAGIIRISGDLKKTQILKTQRSVKDTNLHNTTIWYGPQGTPYLSFPANKVAKVFTTTLGGDLVNTLNAPRVTDDFDHPTVNSYFSGGGDFVPTDVEELDGLFYVATGYSDLDFVLTARLFNFNPLKAAWNKLAFGGRGEGPGQFGTGHGITVASEGKRLAISDRPNSQIDRFTRYGHYRSTVELPKGSFPCDIDYLGKYGIVGCLLGPDRSKGAPIYILEDDKVVSTIMPKEDLGLENFKHIHNAVLHKIKDKFYIIVQAWNPGDFAILEQVSE